MQWSLQNIQHEAPNGVLSRYIEYFNDPARHYPTVARARATGGDGGCQCGSILCDKCRNDKLTRSIERLRREEAGWPWSSDEEEWTRDEMGAWLGCAPLLYGDGYDS